MILTEDEARQKFCPLLSIDPGSEVLVNCRASNCMGWRVFIQRSIVPDKSDVTRGYCGYSGIPMDYR